MVTFDETKRQANIAKHGIDLAALSGFFDGDLLTREDVREAYGELRFQSVGWPRETCCSLSGRQATTNGPILFRRERRKNMKEKRGHVSANDAPATKPDDWDDAFVSHSADELRKAVTARRTRGPNKHPTKEQVAVRYSPEVLAYFRATGPGWQTRMDEALREHISRHKAA
jgi:uncharacterized protein (DUF4415 family)